MVVVGAGESAAADRRQVGGRRLLVARPHDNDDDENGSDGAHDDDHLDVLPPVLALESGSRLLELRGSLLECVGAVVQLRQLRVALQHLLHVDLQDADDLVDLGLRLLQPLVLRASTLRAASCISASFHFVCLSRSI
ncbi:hypothetical protein PFISCL1PPCAC_199 [Pristionchus fissidentatus]|uniref:Uncharacterized protein n=1 Tax=Pristionchus fissidentatus TaxID=1538716 RepID=A0AAV5UPB3_9BILA|nr:hypothetical protein PFISCL1PPCAC_199 [Pristionchus fissidentatus]